MNIEKETRRMTITVDLEDRKKINILASAKDMKFNEYINKLIKEEIERNKDKLEMFYNE